MDEPFTSRIFKTIWELKEKGRADATLRGISKKLKQSGRETNLDDPEAVEGHIANKKVGNFFKEELAVAYNHYVALNELKWEKPTYVREENPIRVPTTENVEKLIKNSLVRLILPF